MREAKIKAAVINDSGWQEFSRSDRPEYVPAPPAMGDLVGLWEEPAYHQHISHQGKSLGFGRAVLTLMEKASLRCLLGCYCTSSQAA